MKSLMPALGVALFSWQLPILALPPLRSEIPVAPRSGDRTGDTVVRSIRPFASSSPACGWLGEPVILQNRPGASGTVGMQECGDSRT